MTKVLQDIALFLIYNAPFITQPPWFVYYMLYGMCASSLPCTALSFPIVFSIKELSCLLTCLFTYLLTRFLLIYLIDSNAACILTVPVPVQSLDEEEGDATRLCYYTMSLNSD